MPDNQKLNLPASVAKSTDGTVQINYVISQKLISEKKKEVVQKLGKDVSIQGFRKGNAPLDKIEEALGESRIIEEVLKTILPQAFAETVENEKLKPSMYPKFELTSAKLDEDLQVRAITCEIPQIDLGNYKNIISGEGKAKQIWTPHSANKVEDKKKELNLQEKEQIVISTLLSKINLTIPEVLINEEVNMRLSKLLERIEKLGLSLENYLSSINKTSDSLKEEYRKQAIEAIKIELILNEIVKQEKIEVGNDEIEKASEAINTIENKEQAEEQKNYIKTILTRKKALDSLINLL